MKFLTVIIVQGFLCLSAKAQTNADSARQAAIQQYYQQALQYKNGNGVDMDYTKAVQYFQLASQLGDAQSTYSLAYMEYKGLGCTQDYANAAALFSQGAFQNRDNSMYFYGICWRNGYGVQQNSDSATYWLKKADSLGYSQATLELNTLAAENGNDSAKALVQQISNAAMPDKTPPNKFTKITYSKPSPEMMAGVYNGWLVQYDWSGNNVANTKRLLLDIREEGGKYTGTWVEGGDTANINATLNATSLKFTDTKYKRKDHYSPNNAVSYEFQDASLNMVQASDSLFLAGNVTMFSPDRGEPSKPLFVALSRKLAPNDVNNTIINVGPNPFTGTLNVNFQLAGAADVQVLLVALSGTTVYRNSSGTLQAGAYRLLLQPNFITPGTYFLKLLYGSKSATVKVVKQ